MEFLTAAQARALSDRDENEAIAQAKESVMQFITKSANNHCHGIVLMTFDTPYRHDIIKWLTQLGYTVTSYDQTGIRIRWKDVI